LFIEGDNLEVLKLLQKSYLGKVKMIYIDPPYNTGGEFIYPDNYSESLETYLEYTGQVDSEGKKFSTNTETDGRFHSKWMNMMYPRLFLAKNLLMDDGLIFISIDDNEVNNLKVICNEIFGEENFIDPIIWKKRYGGGAKEKYLVALHEYILVYCKNKNALNDFFIPLSEDAIKRYYTNRDEKFEKRGGYRTHPLEGMKSFDSRENLNFPIPAPDGTEVWPKRQWRWGKERVEEALRDKEIEFIKSKDGSWILSSKQYLMEVNGEIRKTKPFSIIDDVFTQHGTNEIVDIFGKYAKKAI
jgi:adenine-specific DNA-methyltransferase